jgi:hypothetical protein
MSDKQPEALQLADMIERMVLSTKWDKLVAAELRRLHAVNHALVSFVESLVSGWDCDTDAHKYGTQCRKCEAAKLLAAAGAKP